MKYQIYKPKWENGFLWTDKQKAEFAYKESILHGCYGGGVIWYDKELKPANKDQVVDPSLDGVFCMYVPGDTEVACCDEGQWRRAMTETGGVAALMITLTTESHLPTETWGLLFRT